MRTREEIESKAATAPAVGIPLLLLEALLDIRDLLAAERVTTAGGADRFVTEIKR